MEEVQGRSQNMFLRRGSGKLNNFNKKKKMGICILKIPGKAMQCILCLPCGYAPEKEPNRKKSINIGSNL